MTLSELQRRKLRISLRLIAFGIGAGLFFTILSNGISDLYPLVNGVIIGLLIAVLASIFELNIYEKSIRKSRFIVILITRSFYYLVIITFIIVMEIGIARMIKEDLNLSGLLQNQDFRYYFTGGEFTASVFYTLTLVLIINFTMQISRKLGHGVMTSFITGRYYHPVVVNKIFMFINMPNSESIISKIGRMKFHSLINDIVYDITLPIISNHGIIYQYVEDEMVITWKLKEGIKNARAVRCFFDIKNTIHQQSEKYKEKYGVTLSIKAALHCGKVVKGEIGFIKSEIVYHGDVINTTSRILDACNNVENEILISAQLLSRLDLPKDFKQTECGAMKLKGKERPIRLYTIKKSFSSPNT
jgi:adenylate cyclase